MKATFSFLAAIAAVCLLAFGFNGSSHTSAQNSEPCFDVHVAPSPNCTGNVSGATVTISYTGGSQQGTTDNNGWAYFTAPVGTIHVLAAKNCVAGSGDFTQPTGGDCPPTQLGAWVCLTVWRCN